MVFDSKIYEKEINEVFKEEIWRQIDKRNTNIIGYFHQNIFLHIKNFQVPKTGFDVVFYDEERRIFVELKNKYNIMNSSSSSKTYERF